MCIPHVHSLFSLSFYPVVRPLLSALFPTVCVLEPPSDTAVGCLFFNSVIRCSWGWLGLVAAVMEL